MILLNGDCFVEFEFEDGSLLRLDQINEDYQRRLDIDFSILKTQSSHPNKSNVKIYNLNPTTRKLISQSAKKIRFFAGYEIIKQIAVGDIVFADSRQEPPNWVTEVFFGDGQDSFENSRTSITFSEGTSLKDILSKLSTNMGLVVKELPEALTETLNGSLSLEGLTKDMLDIVTRDFGLDWSIQDDELLVTKSQEPSGGQIIVINSTTGLLETPQITKIGIKFKSQLNPDTKPKGLIEIKSESWQVDSGQSAVFIDESKDYNGTYQCRNVEYSGNNYGGPFEVIVEATPYVN